MNFKYLLQSSRIRITIVDAKGHLFIPPQVTFTFLLASFSCCESSSLGARAVFLSWLWMCGACWWGVGLWGGGLVWGNVEGPAPPPGGLYFFKFQPLLRFRSFQSPVGSLPTCLMPCSVLSHVGLGHTQQGSAGHMG